MREPVSPDTFDAERAVLARAARHLLGSNEAAEDVVQEALLRYVERFGDRCGESPVGASGAPAAPEVPIAWLFRVTRNLAVDRLRRSRLEREARVAGKLPEPADGTDSGTGTRTPDEELALQERRRAAIATLLEHGEPRDVAGVLLREAFGTGYADIARGSGRGAAAWRQTVHRTLERVREGRDASLDPADAARDAIADGVLDRFDRAVSERDAAPLFDALRVDATLGGKARGGAIRTDARVAVPLDGVSGRVSPAVHGRRVRLRFELDAAGARYVLVLDGRVLCRLAPQRSSTSRGIASDPLQRIAFCE